MKPTPTTSLLRRVESTAFEHAVFLTYSLDLPFFEDTILRHLLRRECRNVAVFADEAHAAAQQVLLARSAASRAGWPCGRLYSLTPVFQEGAFHPKVAFLVGQDEVEAWVGSGNLEPGGLRANLEVLNVLRCGRSGDGDDAGLVADVWRFIKRDAAGKASPVVSRQLEQIEGALPWLSREVEPGQNRLVFGPNQNAISAIVDAVGDIDVHRLVMVAPFFDPSLSAARELVDALKPRHVALLVQPDKVSFPGKQLGTLKGASVYELRVARYAHAKLVIVEAKARSVMLSGSHNLSAAAMRGKNCEAGLIRVSKDEFEFTRELGLSADLEKGNRLSSKDLAALKLRLHDNKLPANVKSLLIAAELEDGRLTIYAGKPIPKGVLRILPYVNGKALKALACPCKSGGNTLTLSLKGVDSSAWTAVALELGDTTTAPVAVTRPADIIQRFKPRVRPPKAVEDGKPQDLTLPDVQDVIEQFSALMADEFRARKVAGRRSREAVEVQGKAKSVKAMRYEDFLVSWRGSVDDNRREDRSDVEWVLASLVHVTGGSKVPMPVPKVQGVARDPFLDDDSLADDSSQREEELMDEQKSTAPADDSQPDVAPEAERAQAKRRESRLKTAANVARQLKRFASSFPWAIYEFAESPGDLPLSALEGMLNAARFLTSMLGRIEKLGVEEVEYLPLEVWAEFNVRLLHVLASRDLDFIRRLPLGRIEPGLARKWQTALVGYLLLVHAYQGHPDIADETRLCLRIGLRIAGQVLGVDKKGDGADIEAVAQRIVGTMHPAVTIPPLDWAKWAETVAVLRKADAALWGEFKTGADIRKASRGYTRSEPGQWVWWPTVQGLALVVGVKGRNVVIMHEPSAKPSTVHPDFVVSLSGGA